VMTASAFAQRALLRREVEARAEAERVRGEEQAARQRAEASRTAAARLRSQIDEARKGTVTALAEAEQKNTAAKAARESAAKNKKLAEEKLASATKAADAARATLDVATRDRLAAERAQTEAAAREQVAAQARRKPVEDRIAASFRGTAYPVSGVAYSADGRSLATVGWSIQVRDAQTHRETRGLGYAADVVSVALSPDGRRVAVARWGRDVLVSQVGQTGQHRLLPTSGHTAWGLTFSPDGRRLAAGGQDGTVRVWDVATGEEELALLGHTSWVTTVAYSPDGKRLASASADKTVKVWDAATGKELLTLTGHQGEVLGVAFSPDGRLLASASGGLDEAFRERKGEVKVWDAETGREAFALPGHKSWATCVAFSPDGRWLASAGRDKTVLLCRLTAAGWHGPLLTLQEPAPVCGLAFRPDGKRLAWSTAQFDPEGKPRPGAVKTWDVAEVRQLLPSAKLGAGTLAFSPDARRVAMPFGREVRVFDTEADKQVASLGPAKEGLPAGPFSYLHALFSRDGQRLALRTDNAGTVLWDLAGDTVRALGPVTRGNLSWEREEFSPDGKRFLGLTRQRMTLWDAATGKEVLAADRNDVDQVAFSPNGRRLAGLSTTGLKVWNADTGQLVCSTQPEARPPRHHALLFTEDSATVRAVVEIDSGGIVLRRWDAATGRAGAHQVLGVRNGSLLVSPDGSYAARSTTSSTPFSNRPPTTTLRVDELSSGKTVLRIPSPPEGRQFFSPDGKRLLIQQAGALVTVWDLPTAQKILTLTGQGSVWQSVEARPQGVVIYAPQGSAFGQSALWDVRNVHAPQAVK
jgi:WD40 repeat protein